MPLLLSLSLLVLLLLLPRFTYGQHSAADPLNDLYAYGNRAYGNSYIESRSCKSLGKGGAVIDSTTTTIEIGLSLILSGPNALFETNTAFATLLAIDEINASSDMLPGITLVPTITDDAGQFIPGFLASLCLAERGVPIMIGPTFSDAALGAGIIARDLNLPMLSPTASSAKLASRDAFDGYPTLSRIYPSDDFQGVVLADLSKYHNWTSVVTVTETGSELSLGLLTEFATTAEKHGISLATQCSIRGTDSDDTFKTQLRLIKNSGSRIIYAFLPPDVIKRLYLLADELGMVGEGWVWIASDSWMSEVQSLFPTDQQLTNGVFGTSPLISDTTDGWAKFNAGWLSITSATGKYDIGPLDPAIGENATTSNVWPAYNYDAVYFVANALDAVVREHGIVGVNNHTLVTAAIRAYHCVNCATGDLQLTDLGELLASYQITNVVNGTSKVIGTYYNGEFTFTEPIKFYSSTVDVPFDRTCAVSDYSATRTLCTGEGARNDSTHTIEYDWLESSRCSIADVTLPDSVLNADACSCNAGDYEHIITECSPSVTKEIVYFKKPGRECSTDTPSSLTLPEPIKGISCSSLPVRSSYSLIIIACSSLSVAAGLFSAIFALVYKNAPVMRSAQPLFCILFAFFLGLGNISWILKLGEHTDLNCMFGESTFHICFTLGFGAIVCKMNRVLTIFNNKKLKRIQITDADLINTLIKLVSIDVVILVLWILIDPLRAVEVTSSIGSIEYKEVVCKSDGDSFTSAAYCYKLALLLYALNSAYRSREIPAKFSESREIAGAIYIISLMSIISSVAGAFTDFSGSLLVTNVSAGLATVSALSLFFCGKVANRKMSTEEFKEFNATATTSNNSTGRRDKKSASIESLMEESMKDSSVHKVLPISIDEYATDSSVHKTKPLLNSNV